MQSGRSLNAGGIRDKRGWPMGARSFRIRRVIWYQQQRRRLLVVGCRLLAAKAGVPRDFGSGFSRDLLLAADGVGSERRGVRASPPTTNNQQPANSTNQHSTRTRPMTSPDTRIVSPAQTREEEAIEASIRPRKLAEYLGQQAVREQMEIYIEATRRRGEALDHVLIFGPPGLITKPAIKGSSAVARPREETLMSFSRV